MIDLHKILHELNENLNDARSVMEASDKLVTAQFKKHITLISTSQKRVNDIQNKVDSLMERGDNELR